MSTTDTLTAAEALERTLNALFGDWRTALEVHGEIGTAEDAIIKSGTSLTLGDLRAWSAPLRSEG